MPTAPIATKKGETQADLPILLFEITSVFTDEILRLSTHGNPDIKVTFGGNDYTGHILRIDSAGARLFSENGIDQPDEIRLVLGDVANTYKAWDNANFFHFADCTVTLVFWNPTENVTSTDSLTLFRGMCDTPSRVTPNELELSVLNRLLLQLITIPSLRISSRSPTIWPAEGVADSKIADEWDKSESDRNHPAWAAGYGPLRGIGGFAGSNPLGNFRTDGGLGTSDAPTTADIFSSTTIGKTGLTIPVDALKDHIVAIMGGTGASQARRIQSNTATTITLKGTWATTPDGTSQFVVCYGWNGNTKTDFKNAGMFDKDFKSRITRRFRGFTFTPSPFRHRLVNGQRITTPVEDNAGKFGDLVPRVYGKAWVPTKMILNLRENVVQFHMLVCEGEIGTDGFSRVVIEGTTINRAVTEADFDITRGWYIDPPSGRGDKADNQMDSRFSGHDPYNLIAVIYGAVPPEFVGGSGSGEAVGVFGGAAFVNDGLRIEKFDKDGGSLGFSFDNNTVWCYLDMLKLAGFKTDELNLPSFHAASVYGDQTIKQHVSATHTRDLARLRFNAVLDSPRSAADALRGARKNARLISYLDDNGKLGVRVENRLPDTTLTNAIGSTGQQFTEVGDLAGFHPGDTVTIDQGGGNEEDVTIISIRLNVGTTEFEADFANTHSASETVKGKVAFSFDSTNIFYLERRGPAVERFSTSIRETPNTVLSSFLNELRDFTQDGGEIVDAQFASFLRAKSILQGQADGLPNTDAFARMAKLQFSQTLRSTDNPSANLLVKIQTSVKGVLLKIGEFVEVTYSPESWTTKLFRVVGIRPFGPVVPHENIEFTLQAVDNSWYDTVNGQIPQNTPGIFPPDFPPRPPGSLRPTSGGEGDFGCVAEETEIDPLVHEAEVYLDEAEDWIEIETADCQVLCAVPNHRIYTDRGLVEMADLKFGEKVVTRRGSVSLVRKDSIKEKSKKKIVVMREGHLYWANGILSHNLKSPIFL